MHRKHIHQDAYGAFTQQFFLFEPLTVQEADDLKKGPDYFYEQHPGTLLFPDPLVGDRQKKKTFPLSDLKLVVGEGKAPTLAAQKLREFILEKWGLQIDILSHEDPSVIRLNKSALLILGGAERNACTLEIAKKYQVGLFCEGFPGKGGWGVTTHWELEEGMAPRFLLTCDDNNVETSIQYFLQHAVGSRSELQWSHHVHPGREIPIGLKDFEIWLSAWPNARPLVSQFPPLENWLASDRRKPYREVFCESYLQMQADHAEAWKGTSLGLPNTEAPFIIGIDALRFYQMTGSEEALQLFREMMAGFSLYLDTESPSIYLSGLDFKVGVLCNLWNWIEYHPDIEGAERETNVKLLLALGRMVRDYFRSGWKKRSVLDGEYLIPQNHETFKASALVVAWRYFRRWEFPDLSSWKEEADAIFLRINPSSYKYRENAGMYETYVPEHALVWHEATDRPLSPAQQESLAGFALREWMTRDNFLYPVDYGDCDPRLKPQRPIEISPWITQKTPWQKQIVEMELSCHGMFPWVETPPHRYFIGLHRSVEGRPFTGPVGWMVQLLDPIFIRQNKIAGPKEEAFDKLCWRSGWNADSGYLAVEGVGNQTLSHAHNEANGILRFNLAGRIWLFTNGYGKLAGIKDAAKAFRSRNKGPEELNMLVVRPRGDGIPAVPPFHASLKDYADGPLPYSVSDLPDYGGVDWRRHIVILPKIGMIVFDRVRSIEADAPLPVLELQWNLMGKRTSFPGGDASFEQDEATLHMSCCGTAVPQWKESPIAVWRKLVEDGTYEFTQSVPSHGILTGPVAKSEHCFVSGFWLEGTSHSWAWKEEDLTLSLQLPQANFPDEVLEKEWGRIERSGDSVRVALAAW